jgi:hypothetical protein
MDSFDLRKYLTENQLTHNSQQLNELNLKPIVAAGALALGSLGAQAQNRNIDNTSSEKSTYQVNVQNLATNQPTAKGTQSGQDLRVQSYTKVIQQAITKGTKSQISNIIVQVTKITEAQSSKVNVLCEVSGNILASTQEEANAKAMDMIKAALKEANISTSGLTTIMEAQQLFPFKLQLEVILDQDQLNENLKSAVAAVMLLIGSLGAQAQMKPEYQKAIAQIQQDYPGRENAGIRRTKIDSIANLNRSDIKGKKDEVRQRAINGFLQFTRPDLIDASPEEILKAYLAWEKERNKGEDQPCGNLNDPNFSHTSCPISKAASKQAKKDWKKK